MRTASKNTLVITGYSDDNLEFDGSIHDEVSCYDETPVVELPDGTIFLWQFTGIWEVEVRAQGDVYKYLVEKGDVEESIDDIVTINAKVPYVVVRMDSRVVVLGELELTKAQHTAFTQLRTLFFDLPEFEERENTVKAILAGIDPY